MLHRERRENRLWNFDYNSNGRYFITICTKDRKNCFGEIVDKKMNLSEIGLNAEKCWKEIPNHFKETKLEDFVIMPNHIHGIINIKKDLIVGVADLRPLQKQNNHNLHTQIIKTNLSKINPKLAQFVGIDRSKMIIPKIIHGYKSSVTRVLNVKGIKFAWQRSYFDEFIKNEKMHQNIVCYIEHNVDNWENDEFNKE